MDPTTLYRSAVLGIADAGMVKRLLKRNGWSMGVGRFVAGEDIRSAIPKLQRIEASGKRVVLDLLGEFVADEAAARASAALVRQALAAAAAAGVEPYLSVKPTQLGLGVDPDLAFELSAAVAKDAAAVDGHLCLDMENSPNVDGTLILFERLRAAGWLNLSTVLQSYLYRTPDDLERLLALSPTPAVRIVKGAYKEPPEVALQRKAAVDEAFARLVARGLAVGGLVNIATHDERLLARLLAHIAAAGLGPERYELQMLYGVRPALQDRLAAAGHTLRVYVPFGADWYGYFSRRLAERPANLAFVLRGLFG